MVMCFSLKGLNFLSLIFRRVLKHECTSINKHSYTKVQRAKVMIGIGQKNNIQLMFFSLRRHHRDVTSADVIAIGRHFQAGQKARSKTHQSTSGSEALSGPFVSKGPCSDNFDFSSKKIFSVFFGDGRKKLREHNRTGAPAALPG